MNFQKHILKNNLRVILVPIREGASATTLLLVGAGSRYENRENNGISHFLEHMAFKGTKKRPSALEISSLIDGIGAEQNAFTGKEITGFYIKSSADHVETALDVISDMLTNSLLDPQEIEREKGVILEEINLYEDTPMRKIGDIFERLLYDDTPMGWDIAGKKEVIKGVKREDFISYMKNLYSAGNMVLVVAGNIDPEETLKKIEDYFSGLQSFITEGYKTVTSGQNKPNVFLKHKKTEQAHFALGVKTVGLLDEKDRYPLTVLAAILGGGMSSRLFHEIRERRGLAYYVRTFSENYVDSGYLSTFAGVDPKKIDEAIKVVIDEYEKIKKEGEIKEEELEKAKEYISGHFVLDLEDTRSVASFFGSDELLERKNEKPKDVIAKIKKVNLDDINRVANQYLKKDQLNLAIIGDYQDESHFEKLLI
ncbi:insulinase family protein [Patescibacteria group bacterium]|nr:insulinase family protein [Patescibacteria group bacterium]